MDSKTLFFFFLRRNLVIMFLFQLRWWPCIIYDLQVHYIDPPWIYYLQISENWINCSYLVWPRIRTQITFLFTDEGFIPKTCIWRNSTARFTTSFQSVTNIHSNVTQTPTRHYCDGNHHRGPAIAILCLGHWSVKCRSRTQTTMW